MPDKEQQRILQKKAQELTGVRTVQGPQVRQIVIPSECPDCHADIAIFVLLQPTQVAAGLGSRKKPAGPLQRAS